MTHAGLAELRAHRGKLLVLLAFFALHLLVSSVWVAPGHATIDEGVYDFMLRDFATRGSLAIWNGYEEFPSPELLLATMVVHDGTLLSQYPHVFTILATPFYWLFGYRGVFLLNALSFVGAVVVCFLLAQRLFRDPSLSLNSCLLLIFATFAWEYAQTGYPHAVCMLLVVLAVYCAVCSLQAPRGRRELWWAYAAGLTLGLGVGVRLDTIFALPAMLLPFVFAHPWRPRPAVVLSAGLLPGLILLSVINYLKFGTISPFSYGVDNEQSNASGVSRYLPIVFLGAICFLGVWVATRPASRRILQRYWRGAALAAIPCVALALFIPQIWTLVAKLLNGGYQVFVDFRIRDLTIIEGGLTRGPSGGMVYLTVLKKSLLQSAPYLVALVLPLINLLRGKDVLPLAILFLVPAAFIGVYGYFAWHGGCCAFNMRYFVPALPFLAILTAHAWREIAPSLRPTWLRVAILLAVTVFVVHYLVAYPRPAPMVVQELIFLAMPLAIAFVLGALLLLSRFVTAGRTGAYAGAASAMMFTALVWGALVSLTYDFPRSYFIRAGRVEFSKAVGPLIESDSILFAPYGDQFFGLIERGDVRFARPWKDDYATFRPLIDHHLDAGRAVYLWRTPEIAATLERRPLLEGLSEVTLYEQANGVLTELQRPRQARR